MRLSYRWAIVITAVVLASWGLAPTILDAAADSDLDRDLKKKKNGKEVKTIDSPVADFIMNNGTPLTLGLDLQGGLLLQYKVLLEKAIQDKLRRMTRDVESRIEEAKKSADPEVVHPPDTYRIEVKFQNASNVSVLGTDFMANYTNLEKVQKGDGVVHLIMRDDYVDETKKFVVKQAVETIRERVNSLGVTEPSITRRGQSDIVVQLPGLKEEDRERAKELIGQTARLRFRLVEKAKKATEFVNSFRGKLPTKKFKIRRLGGNTLTLTHPSKERLKEFFEGRLDDKHIIGYKYIPIYKDKQEKVVDKEKSYWRTYYIKAETRLTGSRVQNARVTVDRRTQRPVVSLTLDREGAEKFAELTRKNVDERFAIMLDDEVQSAPVIREAIPGGRAQISMGTLQSYTESQKQAQDLVIVLRHGALPAPIELQYQTAVGPTLGQESIDSSVRALALGSLLVIIFMAVYYRKSGLISVLALLLNMLFVMSVLASLGATLTLPGIAGIILTVGMAVDANVIIFERIREEQRKGSDARESVKSGFDKALSAVMDANVTTGIAALVLMQYGTGPIRGFAVTLLIGIVGTIFTAVFCSRVFFDTWLGGETRRQDLSI